MPARKKPAEGDATPPTPAKKRKTADTSAAVAKPTRAKKTVAAEAPPVGAASGKSLVIVESPAKAKTIQKYLGAGFEVRASYGHVRDLPPKPRGKDIGIDIEAGWKPTYVNLADERHKQVLADLKKRAAVATMVYLAPDPDREGEAIAWHLKEALKLTDDRIRRVTFNEITKKAVQEAFTHPSAIDMDRVRAQEARRFLDRAVGYKLSPLLRKKIARSLSAGRVQSVAVRLIVEREREIEKFKQEEYWKITAHLAPRSLATPRGSVESVTLLRSVAKRGKNEEEAETTGMPKPRPGETFLAELAEWDGKKFEAANEEQAVQIANVLLAAPYVVAKVEQKDRTEKAPPPFTTSTLQQQANVRLGYSARRTMSIAQKLYEGVELGSEGPAALITYMRTDSTRVSEDALKACRDLIGQQYGDSYLPPTANRFASGKSAQEAHEAVRPTDLGYTPERVGPFLSEEQRKLYDLIYRRFVASQMAPAVFAVTNVEVKAAQGVFKAQGKILKFDGYRRVLSPRGKQEDETLPALAEKQPLDLLELPASQHFTQPPPRYNEASLVKALEKEGIGRPSTYAAIIEKIKERNYVKLEQRRFYATKMGTIVTDKLVLHFPDVLNLKFTSEMEEKLDQIADRKTQLHQVLDDFWGPFSHALAEANEKMEAVKGIETGEACPQCQKPLVTRFSPKTGNDFVGCSGWPECKYIKPGEGEAAREMPVETEHKCPNCGKAMLQRMGRRGPFLGCGGYPECKTTMNFDVAGKPVLASRPTDHVCEKCGKPMALREGPRGPFLGCTGYPKCRNLVDVDAEGNPVKPIDTGVKCEKCSAPMAVKRGPRGPFLGCSAYPKCRSTKPVPEELKEKLKTLMPTPAKKEMPAVEVTETCPECNGPMALRESRRGRAGYFLGCKKYPKCKGTCEVPPELLEKVMAT